MQGHSLRETIEFDNIWNEKVYPDVNRSQRNFPIQVVYSCCIWWRLLYRWIRSEKKKWKWQSKGSISLLLKIFYLFQFLCPSSSLSYQFFSIFSIMLCPFLFSCNLQLLFMSICVSIYLLLIFCFNLYLWLFKRADTIVYHISRGKNRSNKWHKCVLPLKLKKII